MVEDEIPERRFAEDMDRDAKISLEYDYYGVLLSERQREVMNLYHEENLSLSEISQELKISRQAVHDALKNAQAALTNYEEKLGLVERFEKTESSIKIIDGIIGDLIQENHENPAIGNKILEIKKIIERID